MGTFEIVFKNSKRLTCRVPKYSIKGIGLWYPSTVNRETAMDLHYLFEQLKPDILRQFDPYSALDIQGISSLRSLKFLNDEDVKSFFGFYRNDESTRRMAFFFPDTPKLQLDFLISRAHYIEVTITKDIDLQDHETAEEVYNSEDFKHLRIFPTYACAIVRSLLHVEDISRTEGVDIFLRDAYPQEIHGFLLAAAACGRTDLVDQVYGSNRLEELPTSGRDALLLASEFGLVGSIERLVTTWKEDVNAYVVNHGEVRRSSLMVALMYPKMNRTIEVLCELGADVDVPMAYMYSPIFEAISGGNPDGVKVLIKHGVNVNVHPPDLSLMGTAKGTPLHNACDTGQTEIVKLLIKAGADVNAENNALGVPLFVAVKRGAWDIVEFLLQNGADIEKKDKDGYTPLHVMAKENNDEGIKKVVTKFGANMNALTGSRHTLTALHVAAETDSLDAAKALLDLGMALDVKDSYGYTPLMTSAMYNRHDIIKLLLERGADKDIKFKNRNAAFVAAEHKHFYCAFLLGFFPAAPVDQCSTESIINHALKVKEMGNSIFKDSDMMMASFKYSEALLALDLLGECTEEQRKQADDIECKCMLNLAASSLKSMVYVETIDWCDRVLKKDPQNVKALFRRGDARKSMVEAISSHIPVYGNEESIEDLLQKSLADFGQAVTLDPSLESVVRKKTNEIYCQDEYGTGSRYDPNYGGVDVNEFFNVPF